MSTRTDSWLQGPGYCGPEVDSALGACLRAHSVTTPEIASCRVGGAASALSSGLTAGLPLTEAVAPGFDPGACGHAPAETSMAATPGQPGAETVQVALNHVLARIWELLSAVVCRLWATIEARRLTQRRRSLRVVESVGMGEKRFVAIVEVEQARFLVGGGTAGVSLLARLDAAPEFSAVLSEQVSADGLNSDTSTTEAGVGVNGAIGTVKVAW